MKYEILAIMIVVLILGNFGIHLYVSGAVTEKAIILLLVGLSIASWILWLGRSARRRVDHANATIATGAPTDFCPQLDGKAPATFSQLVASAETRLVASQYVVSRDVHISDAMKIDVVATRLDITLPGIISVRVFQHLFLRRLPVANVDDFDSLFSAAYEYVNKAYGDSLLRGRYAAHVVLPALAVDVATPELVAFATGRPPKRWMKFEFPVLYDVAMGRAYYFHGTARLGKMFFPSARALAQSVFASLHYS